MHELDDRGDGYRPEWYAGPPPPRTKGPVVEAYLDTLALDVDCPDCGVGAGEFCRHPLGHERKMPCLKRVRAAAGLVAA